MIPIPVLCSLHSPYSLVGVWLSDLPPRFFLRIMPASLISSSLRFSSDVDYLLPSCMTSPLNRYTASSIVYFSASRLSLLVRL